MPHLGMLPPRVTRTVSKYLSSCIISDKSAFENRGRAAALWRLQPTDVHWGGQFHILVLVPAKAI